MTSSPVAHALAVVRTATLTALLVTAPSVLAAQPTFSSAEEVAVSPTETIQLFNGKDLSPFYSWLVGDHYADPSRVFTVVQYVDGAPAIRISGEKFGGIVTRQRYRRYRLIVEFRWGLLTWEPRKVRARDGGILLHCEGPDGNTRKDFNGPWMRSIEAQIIEGGTGDFLMVGGHDADGTMKVPSMSFTVETARNGQPTYSPTGRPHTQTGDRVNWYGRDPDWKDVLGFRGVQDVESLPDQWTRLEVIVEDDRITNLVNGRVVNVGTAPTLKEGRILIQSEGAEMYVRRVELQPLAQTAP
jgi:hypothetical protein